MRLLFTAIHLDGSTVEQTQEDKGTKQDWGGSAFSDVDVLNLEEFHLTDKETVQYIVNCQTGEMLINNAHVDLIDRTEPLDRVELIYLRSRILEQTRNAETGEVLTETDSITSYKLGVKAWYRTPEQGVFIEKEHLIYIAE
jgi:hypothetical protein